MGYATMSDSCSHANADQSLLFNLSITISFSNSVVIGFNFSVAIHINITISFILILLSILGTHFSGTFCLISFC